MTTPAKVAIPLIATVAVLLGVDDWPYGYYMLLRLFLCGTSLFLLAGANLVLADWQRWALGGFAVLYNPLLPIRLGEKDIWTVLNVATVVLFWVVASRPSQKLSPSTQQDSGSRAAQDSQTSDITKRETPGRAETRIHRERQGRKDTSERLKRWQERAYRK